MLQFINQDFSFNGTSVIDEENIANFYASFNKNGNVINNVNISFNIVNVNSYLNNQEDVDADFEAFKTAVIGEVGEEK